MPAAESDSKPFPRRRLQFSLRFLFVGVFVYALLFGYFTHRRRESAREAMYISMRQAVLCLAEYSAVRNRLPSAVHRDTAGRPISSWRFQIVPHFMRFRYESWKGFYPSLDQPWDAPANKPLADGVRTMFSQRPGGGPTETNILAVTGPGTAFDEDEPHALDTLPSDTILLVEVSDSGIHWMEPGDLDVRTMSRATGDTRGVSGIVPGGFHVGFADTDVWWLQPDTPFDAIEKFFTVQGAASHDRDEVLGRYRLGSR